MGTRIQDATLISQLTAELEFAVGNTGDDTTASAVRLSGIKQFVDSDKATVAITGSYTDLSDKPNMNDFVQVSTLNSNFYNKTEVDNLIGDISGISFEIVQALPQTGSPSVIYLVYNEEYDRYDEWIYTNDEWVNIGNTNIDLSNYYTKQQTDSLIPEVNDATVTIQQNGVTAGTFTLNQSSDATISLTGGGCNCPQSDWNQTDISADDYIKNKPVIPTVNNPEILFCIDGDVINSITLNQSNSKAIDFSSFNQVQSDWNQSDDTQPSFIKNKPSIPVVNNSVIHFTQGGVDKGSITLNQSSGATIALDGGVGGGVSQVQSDWNETNSASMAFIQNKPTISDATISVCIDGDVVDSFSLNQSSSHTIDLSGATQVQSDWDEVDTSSMAYILNKPTIPAAQVNSDWNSSTGVSQILNKPSLATVATSGSYADLSNKPTVPSNTRTLVVTYEDTTTENITVYTT